MHFKKCIFWDIFTVKVFDYFNSNFRFERLWCLNKSQSIKWILIALVFHQEKQFSIILDNSAQSSYYELSYGHKGRQFIEISLVGAGQLIYRLENLLSLGLVSLDGERSQWCLYGFLPIGGFMASTHFFSPSSEMAHRMSPKDVAAWDMFFLWPPRYFILIFCRIFNF